MQGSRITKPSWRDDWVARGVLAVVAHPDDEVLGCGALLTILRDVAIVHVTDGARHEMASIWLGRASNGRGIMRRCDWRKPSLHCRSPACPPIGWSNSAWRRPGGAALIFNYSYRNDPDGDRIEIEPLAVKAGLTVERCGSRDLALWDAATFLLRKDVAVSS